jgi:hypothetical protein
MDHQEHPPWNGDERSHSRFILSRREHRGAELKKAKFRAAFELEGEKGLNGWAE